MDLFIEIHVISIGLIISLGGILVSIDESYLNVPTWVDVISAIPIINLFMLLYIVLLILNKINCIENINVKKWLGRI